MSNQVIKNYILTMFLHQILRRPKLKNIFKLDTCNWMLTRTYNGNTDTIVSNQSIRVGNEEIIPEWGISVNIEFYKYVGEDDNTIPYERPDFLEATIEFADSSKQWLSGIPDGEGESPNNWIRSGTSKNTLHNSLMMILLLLSMIMRGLKAS